MASRKQLAANRANARKSTGPKTETGKAHSRLNAVKHGLTARLIVIGDEDPAEFDEFRAELTREFDPQSLLACELVDRLAGLLWRLRRVPFFEAAIVAARQAEVANERREAEARCLPADGQLEDAMSEGEWLVHVGRALIKDGVWNDALGKLTRHEGALMNALRTTLQLLEENCGCGARDFVTIEGVAVRQPKVGLSAT